MKVTSDQVMSFAVQEALVEASGKLFWYRDPFAACLRRCGVPAPLVNQLVGSGISKYQVMRAVLEHLDARGVAGVQIQRQLAREFIALPIRSADLDAEQARDAQEALRKVALEHQIVKPPRSSCLDESVEVKRRRATAEAEQRSRALRQEKQGALRREYESLVTADHDRQGRGYELEKILGEQAQLEGLRYQPPFRKTTVSQTDGMITLDGFQYLIEARWRMKPADVNALAALSGKASRNLQSTRALFLSVIGFRPEVIAEMQTGTKNLILMTGQELALILEERTTLTDAIRVKVEEGAKKGEIFFDFAARL